MSIENEKGTLSAILEKIQTEAARKADYIAPTDALQVQTVDGNTNIVLEANRGIEFLKTTAIGTPEGSAAATCFWYCGRSL